MSAPIQFAVLLFLFAFVQTSTQEDGVSTDPNDVSFYLYPNAANNLDTDLLVYNSLSSIQSSRYNPTLPLIMYTSGFLQNRTTDQAIKNAYLKTGFASRANIIVVEWGPLSGNKAPPPNITQLALLNALPLYIQTSSNVYVVGERVSEFISFLSTTGNLQAGPSSVHLVGQSLGAHVMGMAADYFRNASGSSINRVTGTEPAGPLFQAYPPTERLDSSDAIFVDIVHTNQGEAGYLGPIGDVDFFVNGGGPVTQPECVANATNIFCSHNLAVAYYANSILDVTQSVKAYSCKLLSLLCFILGYGPSVQFGEYVPSGTTGSYYLNISSNAN